MQVQERVRQQFGSIIKSNACFVVAGMSNENFVKYGDVVEDISTKQSQQVVSNLCAGANKIFGSVYVVLWMDNDVEILNYREFAEQFPTVEIKSNINL